MTLTKPKSVEMANLAYGLRQQISPKIDGFAVKVGVYFKTVNWWEQGHIVPSPMALRLIEYLLRSLGEPGKALEELDV